MPYQGGGLAAGLASGFTGWMQGKQEAEQRAYERKQEADRIAREKEREAFARLVQENAMKLANAQNQRQSESALAGAVKDGFRPVGDQFEEFNNAIGIDPASLPTIQVNGQTMRKSAPSSAFGQFIAEQRTKRLDESAQAAKDEAARKAARAALPASAQALADALPTSALQSAVGGMLTRQLTPREAPQARWEIRETSQGLVQINPQTGEVRPLTMGGQPLTKQAAPAGPTSDGQRKAAGFLHRMQSADSTFGTLEPTGKDDPQANEKMGNVVLGRGQRALSVIPFLGDELQRGSMSQKQADYDTAKRDFLAAVMRKESGAQITASEWDEGHRRYFPVPGDSPETIATKRKNRKTAEEAVAMEAGLSQQWSGWASGGTDAPKATQVPAARKNPYR